MSAPAPDDGDRERDRFLVRSLIAIMCAICLAGGYLLGSITTALGMPPAWHAPMVLAASGAMFLYLRRTGRP